MLKNKKTAYILLPITLIIWALIGYKVYQFLSAEDEDISLENTVVAPIKDKMIGDSFLVFNNYRDPFLGNDGKELVGEGKGKHSGSSYTGNSNSDPRPHNTNNHVNNNKQPKNQPPAFPAIDPNAWPKIVYNGMITNSSKQQSMGFVSVDGVSNRVKPGDVISPDLKVIQFDQNAITIAKGKDKKTFSK